MTPPGQAVSEALLTPVSAQAGSPGAARTRRNRINSLEALERGFALFKSTFATEAWRYYAGAAPFVICFIPLWVIDGQIQLSDATVLGEAALLTGAYLFRVWTVARYMQGVRERAFGVPTPKPVRASVRAVALSRLLAWKIFLSAATLATLLSFAGGPWFYTACQFASLDPQDDVAERHSVFGCLALAGQWYAGSFLLFLMLFPLWGAVWLNGLILAMIVPALLHAVFGVNTLLSTEMGIQSLLQSSAFWLALFAGAWLAFDPIVKCTCVVVYQHLRSRREGDDLRGLLANLPHEETKKAERIGLAGARRIGAISSLMVFAVLLISTPLEAHAQVSQPTRTGSADSRAVDPPPPARVQELRLAIDEESQRAVYRWHDAEHPSAPTWLDRLFDKIGDAMSQGWRVFSGFFGRFLPKGLNFLPGKATGGSWRLQDLRLWIGLVLVLSAAVGVFLIWRRRQTEPVALSVPIAAGPLLDLSDTLLATEQSEDEWFVLANRLEKEGELRLALRAAYMGLLAGLSQREWLTIQRDRTNREYLDEFTRRWRRRPQAAVEARAEIPERLRVSLRLFDRVWYGCYVLTPGAVASYRQDQRELLNHV